MNIIHYTTKENNQKKIINTMLYYLNNKQYKNANNAYEYLLNSVDTKTALYLASILNKKIDTVLLNESDWNFLNDCMKTTAGAIESCESFFARSGISPLEIDDLSEADSYAVLVENNIYDGDQVMGIITGQEYGVYA